MDGILPDAGFGGTPAAPRLPSWFATPTLGCIAVKSFVPTSHADQAARKPKTKFDTAKPPDAYKRLRLLHLFPINRFAEHRKIAIHSLAVQSQRLGGFAGINIQAKQSADQPAQHVASLAGAQARKLSNRSMYQAGKSNSRAGRIG